MIMAMVQDIRVVLISWPTVRTTCALSVRCAPTNAGVSRVKPRKSTALAHRLGIHHLKPSWKSWAEARTRTVIA